MKFVIVGHKVGKGESLLSKPVYMVGIIDVKDFQTYAEKYGKPVGEMFAEVGAEIVAASTEAEVLEGNWDGNWSVIVKVPSAEVARALYDSEKYAPFKAARQRTLANQTTLAIVPALD
jgi:uncharacterized protein (DUF1330 family)